MKRSVATLAIALSSIIGSTVSAAEESGAYDGTYALEFDETYIVVNCAFSNFAGDLRVDSPIMVTLTEGEAFPQDLIEEIAQQTLEYIAELGLEGYSARRAATFADTFYQELLRALDAELSAYPDAMTVTLSDPLEEFPYMYLFDTTLTDETTGASSETQGAMRTNVGAFGVEPILELDYDIAFDTTVLGLAVTRQMGGVVDYQEGLFRWATRLLAFNTYTELILGCSASGTAPFGLESADETAEPEATPTPDTSDRVSAPGGVEQLPAFRGDMVFFPELKGIPADAESALDALESTLGGRE